MSSDLRGNFNPSSEVQSLDTVKEMIVGRIAVVDTAADGVRAIISNSWGDKLWGTAQTAVKDVVRAAVNYNYAPPQNQNLQFTTEVSPVVPVSYETVNTAPNVVNMPESTSTTAANIAPQSDVNTLLRQIAQIHDNANV